MMAMESVSPVPMAMPTTMEMAKTRTPSAAARVSRKSAAVTLCKNVPEALVDELVCRQHFSPRK